MARIHELITELFTAFGGKHTIYKWKSTNSKWIIIANCKTSKTRLLAVESPIWIRYYYHTWKTKAYMNPHMDPLGDLWRIHWIWCGWEISIELYPIWLLWCIEYPEPHFGNSTGSTQTLTQSESLNQLWILVLLRYWTWHWINTERNSKLTRHYPFSSVK